MRADDVLGWVTTERSRWRGTRYHGIANDGTDDGTRVTPSPGADRQRDAVHLIVLYHDIEVTVKIKEGYRHPLAEPTTMFSGRVSLHGQTAFVSSYPHEIREDRSRIWVVDAWFERASFMPTWSNGEGTRVTAAHSIAGEMQKMLDDEVTRLGLTLD
jgi:hypothetical protein